MAVGVVVLVRLGTSYELLGLSREGDIVVAVWVLYRHVVALASGEDCEDDGDACY